jgi:predicted ATPase
MAYPDATIYEISETGIAKTDYTETENYNLSRHFINNHQKMVDLLLFEKEEPE